MAHGEPQGRPVRVYNAPGYENYTGVEVARLRAIDGRELSLVVYPGDMHLAVHSVYCVEYV